MRRQNFTCFTYEEGTIPAVWIFIATDRTVDFNIDLRGIFFTHFSNQDRPVSIGTPVFCGINSEPTSRSRDNTEEVGFFLVLPFALRPDIRDQDRRG